MKLKHSSPAPSPPEPVGLYKGRIAPSSKPLPLTPFFDSKGTTANNNNTNLYLFTAENHSGIQKRVNIFTPSYKLVSRQNLNRNYIIIINTPKRKLKNLFYMTAVLLVVRIVIVQKLFRQRFCLPIPTGLFFSLRTGGRGLGGPPSKTSKPLILWPPKLHTTMDSSFPASGHNLIHTMTLSEVITTS